MSNTTIEDEYKITVLRDGETGLPRAMTIRLNMKLQSPPDDRPAKVVFDDQGRIKEMGWFEQNHYHRTTGPALMKINPANGIVYYEEYRNHGQTHRSYSEPAWTERDPESGEVQVEHYFVDDEPVEPRSPKRLDLAP